MGVNFTILSTFLYIKVFIKVRNMKNNHSTLTISLVIIFRHFGPLDIWFWMLLWDAYNMDTLFCISAQRFAYICINNCFYVQVPKFPQSKILI